MPSSSLIWSLSNSYGVRIKINFIFLFIKLLLKKLIKTFSALIIFWIPIVSSNYGPSYTRDFLFFLILIPIFQYEKKLNPHCGSLSTFVLIIFYGISPKRGVLRFFQKDAFWPEYGINSKTHTKRHTFS